MPKKVRIQTTIDREIYEKVVKKHLSKYESLNRLIEAALKAYDSLVESIGHEPLEKDFLILKMVREIGMVLVCQETVDAAASGDLKKIIEENEFRILLEWVLKKGIDRISIEEAVNSMKLILPAINVALAVDVQKIGKEIHVIVSSKMKKNYNTLLCEVIKNSLEKHFGVIVSYSVFSHGFEIVIR